VHAIKVEALPEKLGNRCGHDPTTPRYFHPPPEHKARAQVLEKAKSRLAMFYVEPLQWLNDLSPITRRRRSERREAIAALGQVLLHYVDMVSLKVGIALDLSAFRGLTLEFLAKKAALSLKRTQRALQDLARAGYLTIKRRYRVYVDKGPLFKGLPALKTLSAKFFTHLGIEYHTLVRHREWARKQREIKSVHPSGNRLNALARQFIHPLKRPNKTDAVSQQADQATRLGHIQAEKANAEKAYLLYQQGHTFEEIKALLYPARVPSG
jgi:hypothetical protein